MESIKQKHSSNCNESTSSSADASTHIIRIPKQEENSATREIPSVSEALEAAEARGSDSLHSFNSPLGLQEQTNLEAREQTVIS